MHTTEDFHIHTVSDIIYKSKSNGLASTGLEMGVRSTKGSSYSKSSLCPADVYILLFNKPFGSPAGAPLRGLTFAPVACVDIPHWPIVTISSDAVG